MPAACTDSTDSGLGPTETSTIITERPQRGELQMGRHIWDGPSGVRRRGRFRARERRTVSIVLRLYIREGNAVC